MWLSTPMRSVIGKRARLPHHILCFSSKNWGQFGFLYICSGFTIVNQQKYALFRSKRFNIVFFCCCCCFVLFSLQFVLYSSYFNHWNFKIILGFCGRSKNDTE